jgi:hypothetical protein
MFINGYVTSLRRGSLRSAKCFLIDADFVDGITTLHVQQRAEPPRAIPNARRTCPVMLNHPASRNRPEQRLKELDAEHRRSITFDNGTEFARCGRLEKHLGMQLYFADPGCPYQRGTNENTNGLIRQYFPQGTDFRNISHDAVRQVEKSLNNRPRACLGFQTPSEVFFEKPPPTNCD